MGFFSRFKKNKKAAIDAAETVSNSESSDERWVRKFNIYDALTSSEAEIVETIMSLLAFSDYSTADYEGPVIYAKDFKDRLDSINGEEFFCLECGLNKYIDAIDRNAGTSNDISWQVYAENASEAKNKVQQIEYKLHDYRRKKSKAYIDFDLM